MQHRISLFTIVLTILGIMGMVFPPLGLVLLAAAIVNQSHHTKTRSKIYAEATAQALTKQRRARILAFKAL
jgi:hypothetical protein